jgi:hypothetical protein
MADQNRPHFRISSKNVRIEKIPPNPFGSTYERENYSQHGQNLKSRFIEVEELTAKSRDSHLVDTLYFEVKTPESKPIRQESQKFSQMGMEVVSYSNRADNIAIVKVSRMQFNKLQDRIEKYTTTVNNTGKSNISIIEDIFPVSIEEKLSPSFNEI